MSITAEAESYLPHNRQAKRWLWPVSISILIHLLLVLFANRKIEVPPVSAPPQQALQSYLYTPPAPKKVTEVPEPEILPEQKQAEEPTPEPIPELSEKPAPKEAPLPEEVLPEQSPESETVQPVESSPPVTPSETTEQTPVQNWPTNQFSGQLSGQLQQLQQQQYRDMLQQQTQGYRQNQVQGTVRPAQLPALSVDEKLREQVQITANCDNSVNKTLAILSGIAGGTIKCSDKANINSFIQNRLNKKQQ